MEQLFVFGKPVEGLSFTDREKESARLSANFAAGINTFIISPRRWGKTSLVKKVIAESREDGKMFVFLDVFKAKTPADFCGILANAVLKQTASAVEDIWENIKSFLERINVGIRLAPDQQSKLDLDFGVSKEMAPMEAILSLPQRIAEKKNAEIVVCIDEFQQIALFDDSLTFQKMLRGIWQNQRRVTYCLFGSKKHMMEGLFDEESKPFYKFGDIIYLKRIPLPYWKDFIYGKFSSAGKSISEEQIERICQTVDFHSSYVQQLCWYVFLFSGEQVTEEDVQNGIEELIVQNTALFESRTETLTPVQMRFLMAVANGIHDGFSTSEVISKYKLGSSASSVATRKSLLDKGLLSVEAGKTILADPVMGLWLRQP